MYDPLDDDAPFTVRELRIEQGEVRCDEDCGAREEPHTVEQFIAAYRHWRFHKNLSGCSHAR